MSIKKGFRRYSSLIILGLIMTLTHSVEAAISYPSPTGNKYINDYAKVVDSNNAEQIIALGSELEQKTGAQMVVVTMNTLEGIPIEEYANGLFRKWGIGEANKDNGLLIVLSLQEQRWRVEVGRGLEGAIPDALSNRIMLELGKPEFTSGFYGQGLAKVYSQFGDEIAAEYNVTLTHSLHTSYNMNQSSTNGVNSNPIGYWIIIAVIFMDILFNRGRIVRLLLLSSLLGGRGSNRRGGGGFGGGSSNGGGSSGGW